MKADSLHTFGKNIQSLRLAKGLSQEKLAELAELHRTYVGAIERGERNIGLRNVVKLANALEVTSVKLMEGVK